MTPSTDDHAYVLKLYFNDEHELRGNIQHAYSRKSKPIRRPEDILAFIEPDLREMDVILQIKSRVVLWLCSDAPEELKEDG